MPCYDPLSNPNSRCSQSLRVCRILLYVRDKTGLKLPKEVLQGAEGYGHSDTLDLQTDLLCRVMKGLTDEQLDTIVYNGRCPDARKLADWWDEHKQFDLSKEKK